MRRRWLWWVGGAVVVAALGVVGVLAVKIVRADAAADAACAGLTAYLAEYGDPIRYDRGGDTLAVLGDSYAAGDLLPDRADGWAYTVARNRSADLTLSGIGSTGYVNGGYCGDDTFATRINPLLGADTLIIQGGLNDAGESPAAVQAALSALLTAAEDVPTVIVIGPVDSPERDNLEAIDTALADAAEDAGRLYASALDWDVEFLPDRLHMTAEGHQAYAEYVGALLR